MSRLRRLVLSGRYFFVTCNLLRSRRALEERDFGRLASSLARMREKHGFALTAWVFLPDHWHAIVYPRCPLAISGLLKAGSHGWGVSNRGLFPGIFNPTVNFHHELTVATVLSQA
jgi:REP element-mobilizing transposase RayT